MTPADLLALVTKYGGATTIIAILTMVAAFLYKQQVKSLQDAKKEAQDRGTRLEAEVKVLNADLQKYIMTGLMVRQVMNEAAVEMSQDDSTEPSQADHSRARDRGHSRDLRAASQESRRAHGDDR
jgi:hypothetical protein